MSALGGLAGFAEHDPHALGSFEELHHERRTADHLDEIRYVVRRVREARDRQPDVAAREQLHGAELVARTRDGDGLVDGIDAHHLELSHHGRAVEGDGRADARHDGVEVVE